MACRSSRYSSLRSICSITRSDRLRSTSMSARVISSGAKSGTVPISPASVCARATIVSIAAIPHRKSDDDSIVLRLELDTRADPERGGRAGCVKGGALYRKRSLHGGKRAGDERAGAREAGWSELRGTVIAAVEQVVDLSDELQPRY